MIAIFTLCLDVTHALGRVHTAIYDLSITTDRSLIHIFTARIFLKRTKFNFDHVHSPAGAPAARLLAHNRQVFVSLRARGININGRSLQQPAAVRSIASSTSIQRRWLPRNLPAGDGPAKAPSAGSSLKLALTQTSHSKHLQMVWMR